MKVKRFFPILALGLSLANAQPPDPLTTQVTTDLAAEWATNRPICTEALQLKGQGKDDDAMKKLLSGLGTQEAKVRFKIAESRQNIDFWCLVVSAGLPKPTGDDCHGQLAAELSAHFGLRPQDLGAAAKDYGTSPYLALYDLLREIPSGQDAVANHYRRCFADPKNLIAVVKNTLGIQP
jgi:hypothetical protein